MHIVLDGLVYAEGGTKICSLVNVCFTKAHIIPPGSCLSVRGPYCEFEKKIVSDERWLADSFDTWWTGDVMPNRFFTD